MAHHADTLKIIARVRLRIAEPSESMVTDDQIALLITECQNELVWRLPDEALWAVTLSATTPTVIDDGGHELAAVAPGFVREILVKYHDAYAKRLEREDIRKVAGLSAIEPSETNPYYTITANIIYFEVGGTGPTTTDNFVIDYIAVPALVEDDTPTGPTFPAPFWGPIENFVVARCWEQRENTARFEQAFMAYLESIEQIKANYIPGLDVKKYEPPQMRG